MKRIILLLLLVALVAPLATSQTSIKEYTIGMVIYQIDARMWEPQFYADPLNADLQLLPVPEGKLGSSRGAGRGETTEPDHYLVDIRYATTAGEQLAAIEDLMAKGVVGLVIMPAQDTNQIKSAVATAAAKVPVVLTGRTIPGLNLPFFGVDMAEMGKAMTLRVPKGPFVVIGNLSDEGYQKPFIDPLMLMEQFAGFYEAGSPTGQSEAAQAINDVAGLMYIVVTNPLYTAGAAEAIKAVTAGTDRLIKLGSLGAPVGWKDLFNQKLLQGVFSWDAYEVLQQAAVAVKVKVRDGVDTENYYPDCLYWTSATGYSHASYPYTLDPRMNAFFN